MATVLKQTDKAAAGQPTVWKLDKKHKQPGIQNV